MTNRILAVTGAAIGLAAISALFTQDMTIAAPAATPARLEAADIIVDRAILAENPVGPATIVENPQRADLILPISPTGTVDNADRVVADNKAAPDVPRPVSLAALVAAMDGDQPIDAETRCLASAVWHEAKSESLVGQLAVAKVVIARRDSGRFSPSLCGVVKQRGQFSFVRGGTVPTPPPGRQWRNALAISQIALADQWQSPVEGALFFHARRVSPGWKLRRIGLVENHIFYR